MLTKRRQQQTIRNLLNGQSLEFSPDLFDDDYYYIWQEIDHALHRGDDFEDLRQLLFRLKMREVDLSDLIDNILALKPGNGFTWKTLETIGREAPPVSWFWPNWIPRGYLTLLAAEQGTGKTNIALNLSHRTTNDLPAPDDIPLNTTTKNVIYIDAERFTSGIYKRAKDWGLDTEKVYIFEWPEDEMLNLGAKETKEDLWDMCYDLKPDLLVIDSFSDIQTRGEDKVEDIRAVFVFLNRLCRTFDLGLLILHHLRKPQGGESSYNHVTLHDIRGSGHITVKSRSVIGLWKDADHQKLRNSPVHVECIKANFCEKPPPIYMHYYHPDPNDLDKFDLLFEPIPDPEADLPDNLTGDGAEWLIGVLADGPMKYTDLVKAAAKAGFKENIVQNARKALGWKVIDTIGRQRKGNKWALHDQAGDDLHNSHGLMAHETPPSPSSPTPPLSLMAHETMRHMSSKRPKSAKNGHSGPKHPLLRESIRSPGRYGLKKTIQLPKTGPLPTFFAYPRRQNRQSFGLNGHKRR